ncbi:MAG: response regulator transcription factor [Bacteroidota bacterium]
MDKIRVLYVEDEPFLGKIVKESLESRDYEVRMVRDGAKALPAYKNYAPDICVLDVMLPNKDGFTIGQEVRALDPRIPILFLTAKNQTQDLLKGFESGGNDYIKKPFSMEELIVRMENLLKLVKATRQRLQPDSKISLGSYNFLPYKYELHHDGDIKRLSHREAQLLQILANNRNYTIERKEILNQVWGDDSFFNSRNLDVYIKKLRDYLKNDDQVRIITLKGVGYHFVVE